MSSGHCWYMGDKDVDWFTAVVLHFSFFFFELQKYNEENFMLQKVLKNIEVIHKFTHIHVYIYTYIPHTHTTHTHLQSHAHTLIHTHSHSRALRQTNRHMPKHTPHSHTLKSTPAHTQSLMYSSHAQPHSHTYTHSLADSHSPAQPRLSMF